MDSLGKELRTKIGSSVRKLRKQSEKEIMQAMLRTWGETTERRE